MVHVTHTYIIFTGMHADLSCQQCGITPWNFKSVRVVTRSYDLHCDITMMLQFLTAIDTIRWLTDEDPSMAKGTQQGEEVLSQDIRF